MDSPLFSTKKETATFQWQFYCKQQMEQCLHTNCLLNFHPISEYLYVIYLKFTSSSCFSLKQSSKASFLLRKYSTQYTLWPPCSPELLHLTYTHVQVQHCLHRHLSCHSHYLPRYCIYWNFFLGLVFWLHVSETLFYNFPVVQHLHPSTDSLPEIPITSIQVLQVTFWDCQIRAGPSHANQECGCTE